MQGIERLSYAQLSNITDEEFILTRWKLFLRYSAAKKVNFQYFQSSSASAGYKRRRPRKWQLGWTILRGEIDVVGLFNLIHLPVHLYNSNGSLFRFTAREKSSARREKRGNKVGRPWQVQERYLFPREKEDVGFFKIHIGSCAFHIYIYIVFFVAAAGEKFARKESRWRRQAR